MKKKFERNKKLIWLFKLLLLFRQHITKITLLHIYHSKRINETKWESVEAKKSQTGKVSIIAYLIRSAAEVNFGRVKHVMTVDSIAEDTKAITMT